MSQQQQSDLDIFQAIRLAREHPEAVKQMVAFEQKRASVEQKLQTGQDLDVYEAIWLSKHYPGVARQVAQPPPEEERERAHERYEASYLGTQKTPEEKSAEFYTRIGYPQYAKKYSVFSVPQGATIKQVTETSEGLTVQFEQESEVLPSPAFVPGKGIMYGKSVTSYVWNIPVPSLSRVLYSHALGVEKQESRMPFSTLGMKPTAPTWFLLSGLTHAAENLLPLNIQAEPITTVSSKPLPYVVGYGLGLTLAFAPAIKTVLQKTGRVVGEKWEPLLWEKQTESPRSLNRFERWYMKQQYGETYQPKSSISHAFQSAPTIEKLEREAAKQTGVNVRGIRELPPEKEVTSSISQVTVQVPKKTTVAVQKLQVGSAKTFMQGVFTTETTSPPNLVRWLGKAYPGTQKASLIEEAAHLHYPWEVLSLQVPKATTLLHVSTTTKIGLATKTIPSLLTKTTSTSVLKEMLSTEVSSISISGLKGIVSLRGMQIQKQSLLQKQIQKQKLEYAFDFPEVFKEKRRGRKDPWAKKSLWTFPIADPEALLK